MKKIFFIVAWLLFLFLAGCSSNNLKGNAVGTAGADVKEFTVDAFQFGYDPDIITVDKGDKVKININNVDVPHGMRIPDFGVQGQNSVEFTANQTGEFTWRCFIPCGSAEGHMKMMGKIIVR